jgi:hypothetical protein
MLGNDAYRGSIPCLLEYEQRMTESARTIETTGEKVSAGAKKKKGYDCETRTEDPW